MSKKVLLFYMICDIISNTEVIITDISGIDFLGIDRVIKRSTAEIIEQNDNALLVFDKVSKAYKRQNARSLSFSYMKAHVTANDLGGACAAVR